MGSLSVRRRGKTTDEGKKKIQQDSSETNYSEEGFALGRIIELCVKYNVNIFLDHRLFLFGQIHKIRSM